MSTDAPVTATRAKRIRRPAEEARHTHEGTHYFAVCLDALNDIFCIIYWNGKTD